LFQYKYKSQFLQILISMPRYFQLNRCKLWPTHNIGRYCGNTPSQAAKKCASSLFRKLELRGVQTNNLQFSIREVTRSSRHKIYFYQSRKIRLTDPTSTRLRLNGDFTQVQFRHKIVVHKHQPNDMPMQANNASLLDGQSQLNLLPTDTLIKPMSGLIIEL